MAASAVLKRCLLRPRGAMVNACIRASLRGQAHAGGTVHEDGERRAGGASHVRKRRLAADLESATANEDLDHLYDEDQVQFSSSAYPERSRRVRDAVERLNAKHRPEDVRDDSLSSVILFPGQGSQFVGMARRLVEDEDLPMAKALFERASQILDYDLLRLCLEGPMERLSETRHCQPAVVVSSLAAVEKLYKERPDMVENCMATMGFSVGEITALIFSGALSFEDGIHLVKVRAEAMQYCSELAPSGMISVFFGADNNISLATKAARKWINDKHGVEEPVCQVANFLYTGCKVIAGHREALEFIEQNKADFGIRRVKWLSVSGAFHTPLMEPAVPILKELVSKTKVNDPRIPVHSNYRARVLRTEAGVRQALPKQVVNAVKWEQTMAAAFRYEHESCMPSVFECGPGNALSAILKKVNGKAGRRTTCMRL